MRSSIKNKKLLAFYTWSILIAIGLTSCSFPSAPDSPALITATFPPLPTLTAKPTQTSSPEPPKPPTSTATTIPSETPVTPSPTPQPVAATVSAEILNVREGPGTVFNISFKLNEGDSVTILSQAPGGEWVLIKAVDEKEGWAATSFLSYQGGLEGIISHSMESFYIIHGRVLDQNGEPVNAIMVAVYQGSGAAARRTDANTNSSGDFYAYLPVEIKARWQVEVVGIGCTSSIVDAECRYEGRFEPAAIIVELPQVSEAVIITYIKP